MLFSIVLLIVCLTLSHAQSQSANYVRYDNYSAADFDSVAGQFVPTNMDCLAQSNASPMTNGVVYNDALKICKLLTALNNDILVNIHVNPGWVVYIKDISERRVTIFKVQAAQSSSNNAVSVANAFYGTGNYTSTYTSAVASLSNSQSCNCTYRNAFIDKWNASKVYVQIFKDGIAIATIAFKSYGTTSTNWFGRGNVIASAPYSLQELRTISLNIFSFGHATCGSSIQRTFVLWQRVASNCVDYYYMVTSIESGCCSYVKSLYPNILASLTNTNALASSTSIAKADFLLVSVNPNSRVVIVP